MDSNVVIKKLERKLAKQRVELFKRIKAHKIAAKRTKSRDDKEYHMRKVESLTLEVSRLNRRTISGLTYGIKANYFSKASGTTGFNPEDCSAHSYTWYSLCSKFKLPNCQGKTVVVLNTYRYSQQTSVHIWRVAQVLKDLGIKYRTLNAPRGLQDLHKALEYELRERAESLVTQKYSRGQKRDAGYFKNKMLNFSSPQLRLLEQLGQKPTKKMRLAALESAEQRRRERNERTREKSAFRRKAAQVVIVSDYDNKMHSATDGIHLVESSDWNWDKDTKRVIEQKNYRNRSVFQWYREEAVRENLTKIYIHSSPKKHLSAVSE